MKRFLLKSKGDFANLRKDSSNILVITHNGIFHADEVFAVALLKRRFKDLQIFRTRDREILDKALDDPSIFLVDVGMHYNPSLLCFDHHQGDDVTQIESSLSLLFKYLYKNELEQPVFKVFYQRLIQGLCDWDAGATDRIKVTELNVPVLPQVISGFNRADQKIQDTQFLKAVNFASEIIQNELNTSKQIVLSEKIWESKQIMYGNTAVLSKFCPFWRIMQKQPLSFPYILQPSDQGWSIMSVDSIHYPLPEPPKSNEILFCHPANYFIQFTNKQAAEKYAFAFLR